MQIKWYYNYKCCFVRLKELPGIFMTFFIWLAFIGAGCFKRVIYCGLFPLFTFSSEKIAEAFVKI